MKSRLQIVRGSLQTIYNELEVIKYVDSKKREKLTDLLRGAILLINDKIKDDLCQ